MGAAKIGIHGFAYVVDPQEQDDANSIHSNNNNNTHNGSSKRAKVTPQCPKQHQLPMFLSSKCHNWSL
jgi:hypothetical protein